MRVWHLWSAGGAPQVEAKAKERVGRALGRYWCHENEILALCSCGAGGVPQVEAKAKERVGRALGALNTYLATRTYLVGDSVTPRRHRNDMLTLLTGSRPSSPRGYMEACPTWGDTSPLWYRRSSSEGSWVR